MNCCVWPSVIEGVAGVTAIDERVGAVTVRIVEPVMEPDVAVIVVLPCATDVASPALLIVAMLVADEAQVTVPVRFCVLPLEYVPVAVNCCIRPSVIEGLVGVTAIDTRVAGLTVRTVEPAIDPEVAEIVVLPVATEVASPVPLIVAAPEADEAHVTVLVRFCMVPSLNVPVAVNC